MKKTKPPVQKREYIADDLTIEVDGETYYPHAGEKVVFNQRPSWGFTSASALAGSRVAEGVILINEELARAIESWDWTGNDGKPLPEPSATTFGQLCAEEVMWLAKAYTDSLEAEAKNA